MKIDLNLDAGESPEALKDGSEEALYQIVSSVNIACGGHTGDPTTMAKSIELAKKYKLKIGAHPSFPDRMNFGRKKLELNGLDLVKSLVEQINNLSVLCALQGDRLSHVKPHGALYNLAAIDHSSALAVIEAVRQVAPNLPIIGLAGSRFIDWCRQEGMRAIPEAFADRSYEPNGQLRTRELPDALIEDAQLAAQQAVRIACRQSVVAVDKSEIEIKADTICIHGDSKDALTVAKQVRQALENAGVKIQAVIP